MTQWREMVQAVQASAAPILIFGPTASGKSALALHLAAEVGGVIVNADASQVWSNWQVLTARPDRQELRQAPHVLYGHLPFDAPYSTGHWLREVAPYLDAQTHKATYQDRRPIIVGGTGLYFKALTEGLVEIPAPPPELRAEADAIRSRAGHAALLSELDSNTIARIDTANPMRVQRAWEVLKATGRGLAEWQDSTPPPLLPVSQAVAVHVQAPKDWLNPRIAWRFEQMMAENALEEVQANAKYWHDGLLSMKVIGAQDLKAYLDGTLSRDAAVKRATIATQQYAKRQRTWGRARMKTWIPWNPTAAPSAG